MSTTQSLRSTNSSLVEPASEHTAIQRRSAPQTIAAESLEYHLFAPRRAHHPLLEDAYEVWRDGWRETLQELDGIEQMHSDEFDRQDEVGVLCLDGHCISVTGLRWLDLSLSRAREDSYFQHWPKDAVAALGPRLVAITNNTIVQSDWRRAVVQSSRVGADDPVKLKYATIGLSMRRFIASAADSVVALARNDRAMHMVAVSMGGKKLGQILLHGIETDIMVATRHELKVHGAVVDELWDRRRQG